VPGHWFVDEDGEQMAQTIKGDSGVTTEQTQGWGASMLAHGPKFMGAIALVLIGAFVAVRVFIGEFVGDPKVALALTGITCIAAVLAAGLAPLIIWIIREASKAAVAGVSQQVSETNQLVKSNIDQSSAVMSALIALTSQTLNQRAGPMQLTGATRAPQRFELGQFQDANGDGQDDDDVVTVWIREGTQWRKVEYSFSLLDDFIRMATPSRDRWTHENAKYGETAGVIESINGSPLVKNGNGWVWRVPHEQVLAWWERAQGGKG
jgi:hypothetical protein